MIRCLSIIRCTLFSNCEVKFNNKQNVYSSNELYAHKAFISSEFSNTKGTKNFTCACQTYKYEKELALFVGEPFFSRKAKKNEENWFYEKLAIEVLTCNNFLLPYVKMSKTGYDFKLIVNENSCYT